MCVKRVLFVWARDCPELSKGIFSPIIEPIGMSQSSNGTVVTPWGRLFVEVGEKGLRRVAFDAPEAPPLDGPWAAAFAGYLARQPFPGDLPIDLAGVPPFARRVLAACRTIPFGETRNPLVIGLVEVRLSQDASATTIRLPFGFSYHCAYTLT